MWLVGVAVDIHVGRIPVGVDGIVGVVVGVDGIVGVAVDVDGIFALYWPKDMRREQRETSFCQESNSGIVSGNPVH